MNGWRIAGRNQGQITRGERAYFTLEMWIIKGGYKEDQLRGESLEVNQTNGPKRNKLSRCKSSTEAQGKKKKKLEPRHRCRTSAGAEGVKQQISETHTCDWCSTGCHLHCTHSERPWTPRYEEIQGDRWAFQHHGQYLRVILLIGEASTKCQHPADPNLP